MTIEHIHLVRRLSRAAAMLALVAAFAVGQVSATLPLEHGTLLYHLYGGGKPLVLVGGFAGVSSDYLIPLARELGKRHLCILVDEPGTGGSSVKSVDTSVLSASRTVEALEALRRFLKVDSWIVAGHAWGGTVALTYAGLHPASVERLLLIGPTGFDLRIFDYYNLNVMNRMTKEDSAMFNKWNGVGPTSPLYAKAKVERFRASLGGYFVNRAKLESVRAAITDQTYAPEIAETYWNSYISNSPPLGALLRGFKPPVLLVQGDRDPVDVRTAGRIRKTLTRARYREIRACGAFPWLERPSEFWRAVNPFLRTPSK